MKPEFFINSHDVKFQTTARSSRACTVYLTQNLPNYISALGENLTYSLLGNLQTKIFHQNSETKTNKYASEIIGKNWLVAQIYQEILEIGNVKSSFLLESSL